MQFGSYFSAIATQEFDDRNDLKMGPKQRGSRLDNISKKI
jgi:hypothetical protein